MLKQKIDETRAASPGAMRQVGYEILCRLGHGDDLVRVESAAAAEPVLLRRRQMVRFLAMSSIPGREEALARLLNFFPNDPSMLWALAMDGSLTSREALHRIVQTPALSIDIRTHALLAYAALESPAGDEGNASSVESGAADSLASDTLDSLVSTLRNSNRGFDILAAIWVIGRLRMSGMVSKMATRTTESPELQPAGFWALSRIRSREAINLLRVWTDLDAWTQSGDNLVRFALNAWALDACGDVSTDRVARLLARGIARGSLAERLLTWLASPPPDQRQGRWVFLFPPLPYAIDTGRTFLETLPELTSISQMDTGCEPGGKEPRDLMAWAWFGPAQVKLSTAGGPIEPGWLTDGPHRLVLTPPSSPPSSPPSFTITRLLTEQFVIQLPSTHAVRRQALQRDPEPCRWRLHGPTSYFLPAKRILGWTHTPRSLDSSVNPTLHSLNCFSP